MSDTPQPCSSCDGVKLDPRSHFDGECVACGRRIVGGKSPAGKLQLCRDERDALRKDLALAEIARDKALITVRQLESENRELAARVDVGGALRNILTIALKSGLTDQVRAEARELLKLPNDH